MANLSYSIKIYNQLMNGKVINREIIDNDSYQTNFLFTELMDNLEEYKKQYVMCGFDFIANGDYVYIAENQQYEDLKTDMGMKVQILLLIIGKFLNSKQIGLSRIMTLSAGLTLADLEEIQELPDTIELLDKAGFKGSFKDNVKSTLVDRHILLEKTSSKSYVLSAIGRVFFEELKSLYALPAPTEE